MRLFALLAMLLVPLGAVAQTYPANVAAINPADMIRVTDATSANTIRSNLIQEIYGGPLAAPNAVTFFSTLNPTGTTWQGATNLASIQEWRVTVSRGFVSRLYRFMPTTYRNPTSGRGAVIVSAGHGHIGTTPPYEASIKWLVASGYEVWTVDMPVSGLNVTPVTIADPDLGNLQIRSHDDMQAMRTPTFNPLRIFMEPVTAIVNDLAARGITNVGMFGLSGGGWTTTLYAALDTRVLAAYSIAGTMPIYARSWAPPHNAIGDWEQREIPALGVDYTDLYILAAQNRRFVNIHNLGDDCCFGGAVANHYHTAVNSVVTTVGGSYATVIDNTASSHTITSWAGNWFRLDLASRF